MIEKIADKLNMDLLAICLWCVFLTSIIFMVLAIAGCGDRKPPDVEKMPVSRAMQQQAEAGAGHRFKAEAQGFFNGGFEGHPREIFIITDTKTGKEYLSITGAGVTELWEETHDDKKVTVEE